MRAVILPWAMPAVTPRRIAVPPSSTLRSWMRTSSWSMAMPCLPSRRQAGRLSYMSRKCLGKVGDVLLHDVEIVILGRIVRIARQALQVGGFERVHLGNDDI